MSNSLLDYANEIRTAAKKLNDEANKTNEDEIPEIDEKEKTRISKEIQLYSTFIRKFLQIKDNAKLLGKISPLVMNPKLKKPRNSILLMLEQGKEATPISDASQLIPELRRVLLRYGSNERYPAVVLLKEILNFGLVNGIPAFRRLLDVERRLYNTFSTQAQKREERKKNE